MTTEDREYFEKEVKEITKLFIDNNFIEVENGISKEEYLKSCEDVLKNLCKLYHLMQPKKILGIF